VAGIFVELERIGRRLSATQLAIGAGDLRCAPCISALSVRVVLLDEPLVGLFDRCRVSAGLQPKSGKCGYPAGHDRPV
jgi:hypothetical protein